jgi:hypothetical protein
VVTAADRERPDLAVMLAKCQIVLSTQFCIRHACQFQATECRRNDNANAATEME